MSPPFHSQAVPEGDSQPPSDEELMGAVAAADEAGFERLYDRYAPILYTLCLRVLGRPHDAQAVVLDVFWEIWRTPERFDPNRGSARTYLMTLARSRAIDHLRARYRQSAHDQQSFTRSAAEVEQQHYQGEPARQAIDAENRELVTGALQSLSPAQRQSLELAYYEGLTHREIAQRLEIPLGSVKTNIRQGLIKLRKALRQVDAEWMKP